MDTDTPSATATQPTACGASAARRPLFSIIVPARNAAATIAQTIDSVLAQHLADWELLVVDDGSSDATAAIVAGVAATKVACRRVRLLRGPSQGVSAARNLGAVHARGRYLAFLDADDVWLPGKLDAHARHFAVHPELGIAFDRVLFVDSDGRSTGVTSTRDVAALPAHRLLYENPACTASTLVVRREAFEACGGFDTTMRFAEDLEFMVRMRCCTPWGVGGMDTVLTHYRAAPQGASAQLQRMQQGWELLMAKVRSYGPELVECHYRHARAVHLRYLARRCARLGLPATQGLALLARALLSSPLALAREPRRTLGTLAVLLLSPCRPLAAAFR